MNEAGPSGPSRDRQLEASTRFLEGGGEMGALMRSMDWSKGGLGRLEGWPQSLRSAVSICVGSRFPIVLYWGAQRVVLYNDAYAEILGKKHPWALGRACKEVWAEIWDVIAPMLDGVVATGQATWSEDQRLLLERRGFMEECYFSFSFSPVRGEDGGVEGIFTAVIENTERVLGERRMTLLRDLAAGTAEARTVVDACERAGEVIRTHPLDIPFATIDLGNRRDWPLGVHRIDTLGARLASLPTGPWPEPPHSVMTLPLPDRALDTPTGVLVLGISSRLALDESYQRFFELVAGEVATAISNARASEDERKRAESLAELDKAKTAFFSNVSHEFRTPLTLMLGPLDDLLAGDAAPDQRTLLSVAKRSGQRLQKLVNTLLDFARIEAGRTEASFEPTDLAALTSDLASNFRAACERAGVRFVVDCPPLAEPAHVDHEMWEKVVLNLVSNAFKFTLEGEIEVALRARDDAFVLTVRDTGSGIPAEELPRMFERFHRIAGTRGRTHEGTGIGLALVQELVKLHGGAIGVESILGAGTTFTVALPRGSAHLPVERVQASMRTTTSTALGAEAFVSEASRWIPERGEIDESSTQPLERAGPRILLADDNADLRDYVSRLLRGSYDVEAVPDGEAALAAARARRPELVIADVMMPKLDGFGLVRALRADLKLATLPVLLLSARAGEESRIEGLQQGADDYLVKPFSARELLVRVGAMLKAAQIRDEVDRERKENEQRLGIALDTGRLGAWQLDLASGMLTCTVRCKTNFGLAADDTLSYQRLFELIHPDDRERVQAGVRHAIENRVDYDAEYRAIWPDGSTHWITARGRPFYDAAGQPVRMVGVTLDITEHKRGELALRDSEGRMRSFADTAPAMLWITEPDGSCTFLSRGWYAFTGQTEQKALGFGWLDATHPDDREASGRVFLAANAKREPFSLEYRMRRKDGEYRRVIDSGCPRFGPQGEFLGYIGAVIDVHELREAEAARRESDERVRVIFGQTTAGVAETDLTGRFTLVNPTYCAIVGRTADELYGMRMQEITHLDDLERNLPLFGRLVSHAEPFAIEKRYVRPDGSAVWVSNYVSPITGADGKPRAVVAVVQDISERKRAEQALIEADRRKDEFLATLSHELRNPLAPLRNAVHVLRLSEADGRDATPIHDLIERQVNHMVRLVDDLLEMSRITRGALALRMEAVEVATVVRNAIETSDPLIKAAGHRLTVSGSERPLVVQGDPVRLAQIVANLLNNAAKYSEGSGSIDVAVRAEAGEAVISVRDTGIGIDKEMLPRLFEMFSRGERAGGFGKDGLGIGLALARRLAHLHGGTIEAHSEGHGKGSEFILRLPLAPTSAAAESDKAGEATAPLKAPRVLVVDDNRDAADSLSLVLKLMGAEVQVAHDGPDALAALDRFRPGIVLLDIGMPGMDGYEVAWRMRGRPTGAAVSIVALSGFGQDKDRKRSREAGFDHHLVKPADINALHALMTSISIKPSRAH